MASILDGNRDVVTTIREIYAATDARKVRSLIEKHFVPSASEKTKNAEIPTPVALVDEMLAAVPAEFWKAPKRVFEPCCGKGNFVLGIFDKFFEGLIEEISEPSERCRVIVEDCLYFADLTAMNVFITTEILKCHARAKGGSEDAEYAFNAHTGDTLAMEPLTVFGTEKFDAVVGNPPYNANGRTGTGNTIWQLFTKKALETWIINNGYLLFVHPPGWRKPNTKKGKFVDLFRLMTVENQMVYLEIHGIKDGQKVFGCGTRYDWYLAKRISASVSSTIVDECGERVDIDLRRMGWLPNSNIDVIRKLLAKDADILSPVMQRDRSSYGSDKKQITSHTENAEFKYPCVHSTLKTGTRFMYSNVNNRGHFGISKIIFGESGINVPVIDMEGAYGMTEGAFAIQIQDVEEGENISKALQSQKFNEILKSTMFSSFRIDSSVFKEFKKDFWKEFV
jgi:Eco57I restriction-modification methylase